MPRKPSIEVQFVAGCFDTALHGGCAWDIDCGWQRLAERDFAGARRALASAQLSLRAAELFLRELRRLRKRNA